MVFRTYLLVRKAVITAAGLGTRLLPFTKEFPKEALPLFAPSNSGLGLKPIIQIIFESLWRAGFRDFCIIVGRGKRAIEDYFTPDFGFTSQLRARGLGWRASSLEDFYRMVLESRIFFVNQPEPKGFGDAVLYAEPFVDSEPFLLHAGDDIVLSNDQSHVKRLIDAFTALSADAVMLVEEVEDPRDYGVVVGEPVEELEGVLRVVDVVEKPEKPPSKLAVVAIYIFKPVIFGYIRKVAENSVGEVQLTDAIKFMVLDGLKVYAVKLYNNERRLDVGTPEKYWKALVESYEYTKRLLEAGGGLREFSP